MADAAGSSPHHLAALEALLQAAAPDLDFLQVVRRLEASQPNRPRVGESTRAADDGFRMGQSVSLAFQPGAIASYRPAGADRKGRLAVNFFGLFGPNGPLPLHLSEYARERERNFGDPTFARFADIFHHRLLSLFYRAWANTEPVASHARAEADRFGGYLSALIGQMLPSLRGTDHLPERAKIYYSGLFSQQTRNAEGLAAAIADHFGFRATVETFTGGWIELPEQMQWRLGRTPDSAGTLGLNTFAGARVWSASHKFRVVLGPLSRPDFDRMLPGGRSLDRLIGLVRFYAGDHLEWDLRLVLDRQGESRFALGRGTRLGWDSWLGTPSGAGPANDVIVNPSDHFKT